jgi:hypothetical protein
VVQEKRVLKGLKNKAKGNERFSPPNPQSQASTIPLFEQEGSAICDLFSELFSKESLAMSGLNNDLNVLMPFFDSTFAYIVMTHDIKSIKLIY